MAVLSRGALVLLLSAAAGCYDPAVRDCTVTCEGAGDCAEGQQCGADHWCASPAMLDRCGPAPIDAPPASDASVDAALDAPPDAALGAIHVVISGRGQIVVGDLGTCVSTTATPGNCTYPVAAGTEVTLVPQQTNPQSPFGGWTDATCSGQAGACTVTAAAPEILVSATFN